MSSRSWVRTGNVLERGPWRIVALPMAGGLTAYHLQHHGARYGIYATESKARSAASQSERIGRSQSELARAYGAHLTRQIHARRGDPALGLRSQRKAVVGVEPYYTVRIPYAEAGRTQWHPTERTGPFSVLTRGSFKTAKAARAWAQKHLGRTTWGVVPIEHFKSRIRRDPKLLRGKYPLAHMSQVLRRDEKGEEIARHPGAVVHGYMLTKEQWRERRETGRGGLPYRYLVYHPRSPATNWTAFFTRAALGRFLRAYGIRMPHEPKPGKGFTLVLPKNTGGFQRLRDDGKPYDPAAPDEEHARMYRRDPRGRR